MSSLLRSTKFVRYFTGAARTLILNSAKTAESNLLVNPKALCSANNVLMRDYASSKKAESLEPLLQKLDSEARRFGRITKRDIDEVFDEIRSKNDITSSQSLLVIRCCGELVPEELPEQRTLLVQKIWNVLTERGIPMDISHYNALLRVYIENEHPFSPAQFLEELEKKGLQPNRVTYQRLMWRYCQEGDVEGATKVLEKMRELSMPVSEPVLNALVMGHSFHGDTEGAKAVLETMAAAGLQPTNRTYTLLACGYAKQGDIEGIENAIKTATEKDAYLTDRDILDIIEHLATGGHADKIEGLFHHVQKGMGYNQDVCNVILRLLNKGQQEAAKKIMKTMPKSPNTDDTPFKGAFFVKQLLRVNKSPEAFIKACIELKEEGLVPNSIYIATETALQQGHTELAQNLFKELQKMGHEIRQHYYWPLLAQKGREGDEEGLFQIIRDMVKEGHIPSGEALRDYVIPYLIKKDTPLNIILKLQIANVPVTHAARNLMIELLQAGKIKEAANVALKFRPRGQYSLITRPLVVAVSKTKDINSFANILHVVCSSSQSQAPTEDDANDDGQNESNEIGRIILSSIKNLSNNEHAKELLEAIHAKGLRISPESAEAIQQHLGKDMTTHLSELLAQLTSSDLEMVPLEAPKGGYSRNSLQLEKLLEKGNESDKKRLQRQLISAYIKENNVEKMEKLLDSIKGSDFELNNPTLAQLYEFYCLNNNIEKAKECEAQILKNDPEFVLNKFKFVQMAYAQVRIGKIDDALNTLKEKKHDPESEKANFMINSKCWQMLNYLAEQKEDTKVIEMTSVLVENNYIDPSNVILGPSIKVFLQKEDVDGALRQFEACCRQYRCTPWKGELMKALIVKEDAAKLQWLADLSTQIHGEVNVLHDLVLAFVECGRLRQARRILETPGLQARHQRLAAACQRYVEEGKSEYLEGLLEATKELSHIDRSNIFYHLLVTYCKADETEKALGLWTILQEEGEIPSDAFLSYLGNHLKSKHRPVPFVVPEEQAKTSTAQKQRPRVKNSQAQANQAPKRSKHEVSSKIESLIQENKILQAMDYTIQTMDEGTIPKPTILKFLLKKLAENGEVEKIEEFGERLTDVMKRNVTYDDKLTLAIFKRGSGAQHIDSLYQSVSAAKTDEELASLLVKFPRSTALASIIEDDVLTEKCRKIAELAASRGQTVPANLLWMEYVLSGRDQKADSLWKQCLNDTQTVVYRRLLQESHVRKQPEFIIKLIETLKLNKNITTRSYGNAYSRLINLYLLDNNVDQAQETLENAVKSGVPIDEINKSSLTKLKEAIEATGQNFKYAV